MSYGISGKLDFGQIGIRANGTRASGFEKVGLGQIWDSGEWNRAGGLGQVGSGNWDSGK